MKIDKRYVPNEMILQYCKIIIHLSREYSDSMERVRTEIHNKILDYVKCSRAGVTREDRHFIMALNETVADITFGG